MARSTHLTHTHACTYICTLAQITYTTHTPFTRARAYTHTHIGAEENTHIAHAHAHTHSMQACIRKTWLLSFFFPYLAKRKKKLYQIDHYLLVIFSSRSINLLSISLSLSYQPSFSLCSLPISLFSFFSSLLFNFVLLYNGFFPL